MSQRLKILHDKFAFSHPQYKKPAAILDMEKQVMAELQKVKSSREGDMECAPS